MKSGKQLVVLPVLWLSGKVDFTQEQNLLGLRIWFGSVILACVLLLQYTLTQVYAKKDMGRVEKPGESQFLTKKAEDGSVAVWEHDAAKVKEARMQLMMSAGIGSFLNFQWGYAQPLLIMSVMQPMQ